MEQCRNFLKKLLFPHGACLFFLAPLSAGLLIYSFTDPGARKAAIYASYILSAYTLTALCCRFPALFRFFQRLGQKNKYLARYQNDTRWRITISLYSSFSVNCAYALLQFGLGLYHATVWYYSMAAYYLMLAVMRFYLLDYTRNHAPGENREKEWRRYRFCGVILVGMNLALAVIVFYMTWQNRTFVHHMITTIAMAAYTFTAFTRATVNLIRYRKYESPVFSAAKMIGLVAAMVSMLTLETTMLTVFGEGETGDFNRIMTGATGAAVTLTVLVMAVYMIAKSAGELKRKNNNPTSISDKEMQSMDDKKNREGFHFTYSAKEQEELKAIRKKYLPPEEDKMQRLRSLDARATNKGTVISMILGVLGVLILGGGMSLIMVWQGSLFVPGVIAGILGMAVLGMAYPVYRRIVKKEREKIAPEVLRLTEELMK